MYRINRTVFDMLIGTVVALIFQIKNDNHNGLYGINITVFGTLIGADVALISLDKEHLFR